MILYLHQETPLQKTPLRIFCLVYHPIRHMPLTVDREVGKQVVELALDGEVVGIRLDLPMGKEHSDFPNVLLFLLWNCAEPWKKFK